MARLFKRARRDRESGHVSSFHLNGLNWPNVLAWFSMAILQFATLPAVIQGFHGNVKYPLSSIVMIMAGLAGYMVRAIAARDILYIVGNGVGLTINSALLWVLL